MTSTTNRVGKKSRMSFYSDSYFYHHHHHHHHHYYYLKNSTPTNIGPVNFLCFHSSLRIMQSSIRCQLALRFASNSFWSSLRLWWTPVTIIDSTVRHSLRWGLTMRGQGLCTNCYNGPLLSSRITERHEMESRVGSCVDGESRTKSKASPECHFVQCLISISWPAVTWSF